MEEKELLELAKKEGFAAALLPTDQVPVDYRFRAYCEENRCGRYGANYSCPPDCGTPEEMHRRILSEPWALVLASRWEIAGYEDHDGIQRAKEGHNTTARRLLKAMKHLGCTGFVAGCSGCQLCSPCKLVGGELCPFPDQRISCMSAYCVDVSTLSKTCGLEFDWTGRQLYLYGMIAFHSV